MISNSPAWKVFPELMPRPTHKDYIYSLEIMNRKEARQVWREGIKACWNHQCAFCDGIPIADESLTLDHVKPKSAGGEDLTSNLIPACSPAIRTRAALSGSLGSALSPSIHR